MCGIAGIYNYSRRDNVSSELISEMTRVLSHRGPDGEGIWTGQAIALGHRRLAILDLSSAGQQPMQSKSKRTVISFNGEIYNFKEIRKQIEMEGHTFSSLSDTEVLLEGFERWGPSILDKLIGMYAFAIWDDQQKTLFIARDKIGIKPLYYSDLDGVFRFASEIKSLLKDRSLSREIDDFAIDEFMALSYVSSPSTGFKHIKQLNPGCYALIDNKGIKINKYYTPSSSRNNLSLEQATHEFNLNLQESVRSHLISDVPVGLFLSGGLDSSGIAYALSQLKNEGVTAYTASFKDRDFDESAVASEIACRFNLKHAIFDVSLRPDEIISKIAWHLEDPFADSSAVAVYQLCQAVRRDVKVVLSGDGADELLAGYTTYRAAVLARYYRRIPYFIRRNFISKFADAFPHLINFRNSQGLFRRFVTSAELGLLRDHASWRRVVSEQERHRLFSDDFYKRVKENDPLTAYYETILTTEDNLDLVTRLLEGDLKFYLPNDMLLKMDRMSMAHGLEVRVPYLDTRLVEYCMKLPIEYKLYNSKKGKYLLKKLLQPYLTQKIINRRKTGFNVPLRRWMKDDLRVMFHDLLISKKVQVERFLNVNNVQTYYKEHVDGGRDHSHQLFSLLMFILWINKFDL